MLTSFDLIFQGVLAINQNLIQILGFVWQWKIHGIQNLFWMVEIDNFVTSIITFFDVIHENIKDFLQEVLCVGLSFYAIQDRQQVYRE